MGFAMSAVAVKVGAADCVPREGLERNWRPPGVGDVDLMPVLEVETTPDSVRSFQDKWGTAEVVCLIDAITGPDGTAQGDIRLCTGGGGGGPGMLPVLQIEFTAYGLRDFVDEHGALASGPCRLRVIEAK